MHREPMLFDELGQATQPTLLREQQSAGKINKAQVHRATKPSHSGVRLRVLKHIQRMASVGATRDEIAEALGIPLSSVCGRVNELLDPRWPDVVETDQRRNTRYGKPAVVVVAVEVVRGT